jgi:hypothetical protein
MASYEVNAYGAEAKVREPGLVVLFFLLTLGFLVYPQVWYYRINRELRDYGVVYKNEYLAKTKPWLSVLATTLGVLLIVPPFVSWWRTTARIRRAQEIAQEPLISGWLIAGLYVAMLFIGFVGLAIPAYVQSQLNGIWKKYPALDPASAPAHLQVGEGAQAPATTPAAAPADIQPETQN